ncbi:MAG TPA: hypothetical protein VD816_17160, partial [Ohtaekwangia sp.]|nr:hypothetical protein [Ohtaekwangia sp.]
LFCIAAWILHFSAFRSFVYNNAVFFSLHDPSRLPEAIAIIAKYCRNHKISSVGAGKESNTRYQYAVTFGKDEDKMLLLAELQRIEGISMVKIAANEIMNL